MSNDPLYLLEGALDALKDNKPDDRSEIARCYAIVITDTEKVIAYFKTYIAAHEPPEADDGVKDLNI